jgi:CRISPR-associated protein Cas2
MSFTVIITRDLEDRFRGFLASAMQEAAPGVYLNPKLSPGVRERVWSVMEDWFAALGRGGRSGGSIIMAWGDGAEPGGLGLRVLGLPPRSLADVDGLLMVCRPP